MADTILNQLLSQAGPLTILVVSLVLLGYYVGSMTKTISSQIKQMATKSDLTTLGLTVTARLERVEAELLRYASMSFIQRDEFEARHKEVIEIVRGKR